MKTKPVTATFIAAVATEGTGGNCMADFLLLKDGKALVISDMGVFLFDDPEDFLQETERGEVEAHRELPGAGDHGMARCDKPSTVGLTFVQELQLYEPPPAPVSVDLLVLPDGRVLGLSVDRLVLYPTMADFDEQATVVDFPELDVDTDPPSLKSTISRMKAEIIGSGVPDDVVDFSHLHSFMDANELGGLCEDHIFDGLWRHFGGTQGGDMPDGMVQYCNDAQDAVDAWIRAGGLKEARAV
jgi:hypothetical protein